MSLILISEHSKSICKIRVTNENNRSKQTKTDRWNIVHQLSQVERYWIWREVALTNCSDLGNRFETINVRNKSQRVA